mmetsp:Transcript_62240/g.103420  ORF Transcript_62240/g.103420 Transcript_62240/m.103420 type:complete len:563 (+) Transcript_62240:32-1720(+)|eukprot:CAMPEP_0119300816 /NCGR_PEP_ID=MMETSP1333-20130426/2709_1 /TAXON_ID=418940 /ORGANISM="Scyphosphaera apsteinii, Strain RCC1455" /LENGTH=562 /DNA_ID=CAMNT_0007302717 /DNA_START=27 /DNA_END=1715 /DNA_ORIENTATION=+
MSVKCEPETKPVGKMTFKPFRQMRADLARRRPHYISDWTDGFHRKVISASLFMFFTSVAPAVTFSAELEKETRIDSVPQIGPVEVILSTAITGCIFAIFGGQPLCIVGVTGPVTIFTIAVFKIADALGIEFLPFYCWTQIWSAIMHVMLAISGSCELIKLVTRYSCETFGMLIAVIYIFSGIRNLIGYFNEKEAEPALLSLIVGLGTAWLALLLTGARSWTIFTRSVRTLIADYGATVAIICFCFVPYMGRNYKVTPDYFDGEIDDRTIATLEVSSKFGPSASGRSWFVDPSDIPVWAVFFALIPALILTTLFFFDHNVSSLLCQDVKFGLKKGTAYHWDYFVVGIQILVTGLLGIPPVNGLIPQAPLHTDSLCDKAFKSKTLPSGGCTKVEVITHCHEQRVSGLTQAVLIGCTLAALKVLSFVPISALDGLFLYMGIASFDGNSFFQRLVLFITDRERRDARGLSCLDTVPMDVVKKYTLLQLLILLAIFGITQAPFIAGLFPVLIAILVPLRLYGLPRIFGAAHVDQLDADGSPPEEPDALQVVANCASNGGMTSTHSCS